MNGVEKGKEGGVMVVAKTGAAAARERARAAKTRLDAERAGREKQIEDAVTEFHLAADTLEAAETAAAKARAGMAAAVETLTSELKEPISGVAVLCGITDPEVRALRKAAKHAAPPPPSRKAQIEPADPPTSESPTSESPSEAPSVAANESSENAEARTTGDDNIEGDAAGLDQGGSARVAVKAAS